MDRTDVAASISWAIGDAYSINLIERKLSKFSSEQLNNLTIK
ncbi:hypothetical protein ACIJAO_000739 [Campylobacter upsaliensis]|nr:hypothetical protein [Campylobacter upsaliensis]MEB2831811.1 hypothetical protein [Campylobacter upsaliensis]